MLSFQSPQKFVIILMAICITHVAFTKADTVKCTAGYAPGSGSTTASSTCQDSRNYSWNCPAKQCSRDNKQFAPMKGCTHQNIPGNSDQQCVRYTFRNGQYDCWNSGTPQSYSCPYTLTNVPFITCSGCNLPNMGKRN
ncbi:uncharacterized protein MELLADRAFT_101537 [Melampsora larici-populina 98AG31]|uniref:Secreted protein n=1 Tax=Melampsora larici-populina (strain 98AG31 / pathotype 3-4-7) TaxID=747676 RepID=F4R660_MELLP|nr:uncharacterized protein MELLADRAFT_101537 [Melampsora larici-populina 98AG31]EGG11829.1 secreted protein [Melampsora larici-populina 98AG31]